MKTLVANFKETTEDFSIIGKTITLAILSLILLSAISLLIGVAFNGAPVITLG